MLLKFNEWTPEYFCANSAQCTEALMEPKNRAEIPLLNCTDLHALQDTALVRFRGMIQDMQDPECYLEQYEVYCKDDDKSVRRVQNGRYRDILVLGTDEQVDMKGNAGGNNKYGERRSMFVISTPGINRWVVEHEASTAKAGGGGRASTLPDIECSSGSKRSLESENMDTSEAPEAEKLVKKADPIDEPGSSSQQSSVKAPAPQKIISAEYLLNSPIPERPSKACLVKVYSNMDELKLNTLVDVVGFLSVDPALDGSGHLLEEHYEDEMSEHQATHPPPSLVPRVHAISIQPLAHTNVLLYSPEDSSANVIYRDIWRDIHNLLTQCLFSDKLAAEYLLCHLISTVYVRSEFECLGQFSVNLSNLPAESLPDYVPGIYRILEELLPASHYFPLTLDNLNNRQFIPKKDYATNKLTSGLLQLAPHTHLVLDETRLEVGKLESSGVEAVQCIAHLIKTQKLKANFQYYNLEYDANIPVLVLSEGKSMLPSDCHVPLVPDPDAVVLIEETLKAGLHYIQPKLRAMRTFLTRQRLQEFEMKTFDPEVIQNDFVQMRKEGNASAEDLHSLLVLARLVGLSRGRTELEAECYQHAKRLEEERKQRIDMFTKRKNEI